MCLCVSKGVYVHDLLMVRPKDEENVCVSPTEYSYLSNFLNLFLSKYFLANYFSVLNISILQIIKIACSNAILSHKDFLLYYALYRLALHKSILNLITLLKYSIITKQWYLNVF